MNLSRGVGEMGDLRVEEIDEVADFKGKRSKKEKKSHFNGRKITTRPSKQSRTVFRIRFSWFGRDVGPRRKS